MNNKKFKMPDSFTILFIIIIIVALLTWIVPSGEYSNICNNNMPTVTLVDETQVCPNDQNAYEQIILANADGADVPEELYNTDTTYTYQEIEPNQQGVWQVLSAPINGFIDALDIALFVLVIGGFLGVVIATGAMDAGINALLIKFKGREHLLIPILMTLFALGGTTYGMAEETIAFYALIVPVFLIAGYDSVVAVMVIMLGAGVGVLASTVNPFAVGVASSAAGISLGSGIVGRFILWIVVVVIAIMFVMGYAKRVKADISKSVVSDLHDGIKAKVLGQKRQEVKTLNGAHKLILSIFGLTFIIMIMSVIPWDEFGINLFVNIADFINANIMIIGGASGVTPLGWWWFNELSMLFLTSAMIIGVIASKKGLLERGFITEFIEGSKDLLSVALIIGLSRGIYVIMSSSGMDATLLYYGSQTLQNLGKIPYIIGSFIFYLPMSFLIPSTSGLANATIPVLGPLGGMIYEASGSSATAGIAHTITSFSVASGIVNLVTPTSGVVMGGLAIAQVPYDRWLKVVAKFILVLIIVCIIALSIMAMLA